MMADDDADRALDALVARAAETPVDADRLAARVRQRLVARSRDEGLTAWLWALPRPVAAGFAAVLVATPVAVAALPLGPADPLALAALALAGGTPLGIGP
jgi:hypothetical protein